MNSADAKFYTCSIRRSISFADAFRERHGFPRKPLVIWRLDLDSRIQKEIGR